MILDSRDQLPEIAAIVASTDDAIVGTRAGVITSWNPGAERLYGYSAAEAIGQPITIVLVPERASPPTDLLDRLRAGEAIEHFEDVRLRKDGTRIHVSVSVAPVRDEAGQVVGVATISRDISRQKQAEAELREREEQYRGVFAATTDGLSVTDLETGRLVDVNPAFCAMHGYTRDEMLAMHPSRFIHPDDHPIFADFLDVVRGRGHFRARARDVRKDGTVFSVEVRGTPFIHGGRPRALAVVRDVTDQVQAVQLLEQRVEVRTRELSTLLGVARDLASTLDVDQLVDAILEQLKAVVAYDAAAIFTLQADALVPLGHRVPTPFADGPPIIYPLARPEMRSLWQNLQTGRTLIVDDIYQDSVEARALLSVVGNPPPGAVPFARAWLGSPLITRRGTIGVMGVWSGTPGAFTPRHAELANALAAHAAVAIENARLHAETGRRLREIEVLYRADEALYGSLRVDDVLQALADIAADALGADKTSVLAWDERGDRLVVRATHGFGPAMRTFSLPRGQGIAAVVVETAQPVVVEDVATEPRVARYVVEEEGVRSLMSIPIVVGGEVLGVFGVNYCRPHTFGAEEQELLLALARRAAAALENARLYDRSERRSRELATLLDLSRNLVSTLALEPLLGVVLDQLKTVVDYDSTAIMTLEGEELVVRDYRGPRPRDEVIGQRFGLAGALLFGRVVQRGAPIIIADTEADSEEALAFRRRNESAQRAFSGARSWLGVPLVAKGRAIGMLRFDHAEPGHFAENDARLALAIANQAAVAIENARLYEQAQAQATAEERQRLARELHDAVTQTLFSASLIAEVLPRIWSRNPQQGAERLEEVRQLTRGALAEMRTLLLELRPTALTEVGLADLLRQLADAFTGRTRVPAQLTVEGERPVPPDVQVALYRVAQEALNNAAKYAAATTLSIHLILSEGGADLSIADDGAGFDPSSIPPGHMGLDIMRERCARIGADLTIDAHPNRGTRVAVRWRGG